MSKFSYLANYLFSSLVLSISLVPLKIKILLIFFFILIFFLLSAHSSSFYFIHLSINDYPFSWLLMISSLPLSLIPSKSRTHLTTASKLLYSACPNVAPFVRLKEFNWPHSLSNFSTKSLVTSSGIPLTNNFFASAGSAYSLNIKICPRKHYFS